MGHAWADQKSYLSTLSLIEYEDAHRNLTTLEVVSSAPLNTEEVTAALACSWPAHLRVAWGSGPCLRLTNLICDTWARNRPSSVKQLKAGTRNQHSSFRHCVGRYVAEGDRPSVLCSLLERTSDVPQSNVKSLARWHGTSGSHVHLSESVVPRQPLKRPRVDVGGAT